MSKENFVGFGVRRVFKDTWVEVVIFGSWGGFGWEILASVWYNLVIFGLSEIKNLGEIEFIFRIFVFKLSVRFVFNLFSIGVW